LLRSAGIDTSDADFWSALSAIRVLTVAGLWVLSTRLLEFLVLKLWPRVTKLLGVAAHP
jgi:hypothetical protein